MLCLLWNIERLGYSLWAKYIEVGNVYKEIWKTVAFVSTWLWKAIWQNYNILKWYENSHSLQKSPKWSDPKSQKSPNPVARMFILKMVSFTLSNIALIWLVSGQNIVYLRHKRRCCCKPVAHVWWGYILLRNLSLSLSLYLTSRQVDNLKHIRI